MHGVHQVYVMGQCDPLCKGNDFMSETQTTTTAATVGQLTIQQLIQPSLTLGSGILGKALSKRKEAADDALCDFTQQVVDVASQLATRYAQTKAELEAQLAEVSKRAAKLDAAAAHADKTSNIFALAAAVGKKAEAMNWAARANLVVPTNDDPIWTVPAPAAV